MRATTILSPSLEDLAELNAKINRSEDDGFLELDNPPNEWPFAVYLHYKQQMVGGIKANVYGKGVEIDLFWVEPSYRYTDVEAELIRKVEFFGQQQGALVSFLKTDEVNYFYHDNGYDLCNCALEPSSGKAIYYLRKLLDEKRQYDFFG